MSVYGDLSKAQRTLLHRLYDAAPRAASIDTALPVDGKSRQTAANLLERGFVCQALFFDPSGELCPYVWLTSGGVSLIRRLDYRHVGGRRRYSGR